MSAWGRFSGAGDNTPQASQTAHTAPVNEGRPAPCLGTFRVRNP